MNQSSDSDGAGSADEEQRKLQQDLRKGVHYVVGRIGEDTCEEPGPSVSKEAIAQLAEVTYKHAQAMFDDMRAFAKHAGRKTINADDVMLVARNNPDLLQQLRDFAEEHCTKRQRKANSGSGGGSGQQRKKKKTVHVDDSDEEANAFAY